MVYESIYGEGRMDKRLKKLLRYLAKHYSIERLYYPASGGHGIPEEAISPDKVFHVSLRNEGFGHRESFGNLSSRNLIISDFRKSPFRDNFFDATLLWGMPPETTIEAIDEFIRVTRLEGLMIVEGSDFNIHRRFGRVHKILDKKFPSIKIPFFLGGIIRKIYVYIVIK